MKKLSNVRAVSILSAAIFAAIFSVAVSFGAAQAASATANLEISATIIPSCTISTTAVAFGIYDPGFANLTAPLDADGAVTVTCTSGLTGISIDLGLGLHNFVAVRRMSDGGTNFLTYELYKPNGYTTVWGINAGPNVVAADGNGVAQSYVVHGRIPGGQSAPIGSYSDTVLATVNF